MMLDDDICYKALEGRDPRYDGRFFTAVRSTGIYCRPVCPAPRPKRVNCTFMPSAAAAEQAGYRPCRRCRPETAPGSAAWIGVDATLSRALRLIEEGALDGGSLEALADRLGVGDRHLRRLFTSHLGASPKAVAMTQRLHLAKRLLDTTDMPMTEIATASGFASLRRFNDAFQKAFAAPPSAFRGETPAPATDRAWLKVTLPYRPPFDLDHLLGFLGQRTLNGIEDLQEQRYRRTVSTPQGPGLIEVQPDKGQNRLEARLLLPGPASLRPVIRRLRVLFDLDADSALIDGVLAGDSVLAKSVKRRPGIRIPGVWSPFEYGVRAIIGQQVSVKGARTVCSRLAERLGTPLPQELREDASGLTHLFPTPKQIADGDLSKLGMPGKRAETVRTLAAAFADGRMNDLAAMSFDDAQETLVALPGIGPWTAQSMALRALGDTDAFPASDLGILKALNLNLSPAMLRALEDRSSAWRPWRGYAAMRLWASLEDTPS